MRPLTILLMLMALFHTASAGAFDEGLQCVPYARALTGIDIRGDAYSWWDQADGRYDRGDRPRVGAVMWFRPHGAMRLGHIAAVRKIIDRRTVIVSHANWSTIDGRRGHIEENVRVVDASADNDWSVVQVWYTPNAALGTTLWPLNGFIYPAQKRSDAEARLALAKVIGAGSQIAAANDAGGLPARTAVQVAPDITAARRPPAAGSFRLSGKILADIKRTAANETHIAASYDGISSAEPKLKPASGAAKRHAKQDSIGDLIGSLKR